MAAGRKPAEPGPNFVRPADPSDAYALADLAAQLGYPSSAREVEDRLSILLNDPRNLVLTAVRDGRVVGWVHAYVCNLVESGPHAEIGGIVVDESCRGKGVGGELMARVEEWARQKGCHAVSARTNMLREDAHRFYEAQGFKRIKTQHTYRKRL